MRHPICIPAILVSILLISCAPKIDATPYLIYFKGALAKNGQKAAAGNQLVLADALTTGTKSLCVVQSAAALVVLMPDTTLRITGKKGEQTYSLEKGAMFIKSLHPKADISIRADRMTALGRDISVMALCRDGASDIRVFSGRVEVRTGEKSAMKEQYSTVPPHFMIQAIDGVLLSSSPLGDSEIREMAMYNGCIPAADLRNPQTYGFPVSYAMEMSIVARDEKQVTDSFLMKRLEMKYGPLNTVTTKSGKKYSGAIRQTKSTMEVITSHGSVFIPLSNILVVARYNYR